VHATEDATAFLRQLLADHPTGIEDLQVRRASLEETYIELVRAHEPAGDAPRRLALVSEEA
jgi:ABC-2 type transport system ATP-binding protein